MITKRQYKILSFFLSRALFFGLGISKVFYYSGNDSWIGAILGMILGTGILSLVYLIKKNVNSFDTQLKNGVLGFISKILVISLAIFCLHDVILALTIMTTSFLLPLTPPIVIALSVIIAIIYGAYKGINSFAKVAEILMPIAVAIFIFKFISGLFISNYSNFFPMIYDTKIGVLKGGLLFTVFSVTPSLLLLILNDTKLSYKDTITGYFWGSLTIALTLFIVIGIVGPTLAKLFRYPEYMALKKIRIFDFIENLENILTFTWLFDLIILGYVSAYNIKRILSLSFKNLKVKKGIYIFIIVIIVYSGVYKFNKHYYNILKLYQIEPFILSGFIILLLICFGLLKIKQKKSLSKR